MSEQHAQSNTFACSACGGQMRFDPEKKKLVCAYCGAGQEIQTVVFDRRTYDLNAAPTPEQLEWGTQVRSIRCPNCGAEFSFSGVEELQKVAQDINVQEAEAVVTATEEVVDPVPVATSSPESAGEEKRKDSLLGKFFKKKR